MFIFVISVIPPLDHVTFHAILSSLSRPISTRVPLYSTWQHEIMNICWDNLLETKLVLLFYTTILTSTMHSFTNLALFAWNRQFRLYATHGFVYSYKFTEYAIGHYIFRYVGTLLLTLSKFPYRFRFKFRWY